MRSSPDSLEGVVRRAARRLTLQRALGAGAGAATAVILTLAAAALATLVLPLAPVPPALAAAAALAAMVLVALAVVVLRPVPVLAAARILDARAGLLERLSTALEVRSRAVQSSLTPRLLADAAGHAARVDQRTALPWALPRRTVLLPAAMVFLFLWSAFFRGAVLPGTPAQRTREVIRQEGSRLERFAQSLQSRTRTERAPQTRRLAPQLRDLGERLQRERVDRAEALARIAELSRQVGEARRDVDSRLRAPSRARPEDGTLPEQLMRRQALQQQIRQLRELTTRLQQSSEASPEMLQRLGELAREGEGDQPARVRENLRRAREELERGNPSGAGESLAEALRELEGLNQLLSDAEGLRNTEQQLQRSQRAIGGGRPGGDAAEDQAAPQGAPGAPGTQRPDLLPGAEAQAPQGPYEGTAPGQGHMAEKLGAPTPRLDARRSPDRVRGTQSEGAANSAEVVGAGRRGTARAPEVAVPPAIVVQADKAMEAARTPGRYRALVRRYFERLARLR